MGRLLSSTIHVDAQTFQSGRRAFQIVAFTLATCRLHAWPTRFATYLDGTHPHKPAVHVQMTITNDANDMQSSQQMLYLPCKRASP